MFHRKCDLFALKIEQKQCLLFNVTSWTPCVEGRRENWTKTWKPPVHVLFESPWGASLGEAMVESFGDLVATSVMLSGMTAPSLVLVESGGKMRLLAGLMQEMKNLA